MIVNEHPERWDTDWLEKVQAWAQRALGCAGRYLVVVHAAARPTARGSALKLSKQVDVWVHADLDVASEPLLLCDPRAPENHTWLSEQRRAGLWPSSVVELMVWMMGHELWHCEDERSSRVAVRPGDPGFAEMERRCDEAGFRLLGLWRSGGRELVERRVLESRAHQRRREERVARETAGTRPGSLAEAQARLRAARALEEDG